MEINFRVFSTTADPAMLQRLMTFLDNEMDNPFPSVEVKTGRDESGRPIYRSARDYLKEVQNNGHASQSG